MPVASVATVSARQRQIDKALKREPNHIPCSLCQDTRLDRRDWMGPTPAAPYPRPCPECSPDLTGREMQLAWATYLHSLPDTEATANLVARYLDVLERAGRARRA